MTGDKIDAAFESSLRLLGQPAFSHLLGIGLLVDDEISIVGPEIDRATNIFSITKAVLAVSVQEALRTGIFASRDEEVRVAPGDRRPTVGALLGMTQAWRTEPDMDDIEMRPSDPLPFIVEALGDAAETGRYVNAGMHLLMRELDHRTGCAIDFLDRAVLTPARLGGYSWDVDYTGVPWGHAHLHLSVRDLLRLGSHWLRQGLVECMAPATPPIGPESLRYNDGMWFGPGFVMAAGWGGQCLMIAPAAGAVMVALGDTGWTRLTTRDRLQVGWRSGRDLFERHLLPAVVHPDRP